MANVDQVDAVPIEFADPLSTMEAARLLGVDVTEVYDLVFRGRLRGGPDRTATVKIDAGSVEDLLASGGPDSHGI